MQIGSVISADRPRAQSNVLDGVEDLAGISVSLKFLETLVYFPSNSPNCGAWVGPVLSISYIPLLCRKAHVWPPPPLEGRMGCRAAFGGIGKWCGRQTFIDHVRRLPNSYDETSQPRKKHKTFKKRPRGRPPQRSRMTPRPRAPQWKETRVLLLLAR